MKKPKKIVDIFITSALIITFFIAVAYVLNPEYKVFNGVNLISLVLFGMFAILQIVFTIDIIKIIKNKRVYGRELFEIFSVNHRWMFLWRIVSGAWIVIFIMKIIGAKEVNTITIISFLAFGTMAICQFIRAFLKEVITENGVRLWGTYYSWRRMTDYKIIRENGLIYISFVFRNESGNVKCVCRQRDANQIEYILQKIHKTNHRR